jgi:hypothetical protein
VSELMLNKVCHIKKHEEQEKKRAACH